MNKIEFSYNWNNKLDCYVFTTLRLTKKYQFGEKVEIVLSNKHYCLAQVIGKKYFKLEDINAYVAGVDTGYSVKDCQKLLKNMYKNKNIDWSTQPIFLYLLRREV